MNDIKFMIDKEQPKNKQSYKKGGSCKRSSIREGRLDGLPFNSARAKILKYL